MPRLNQIIAIETGLKSRWEGDKTELHKQAQKPTLFNGLSRTYRPLEENGEMQPAEHVKVQLSAKDVFDRLRGRLTELLDATATRDYGNCKAVADVVVDGKPLLKAVPVTYLLWLEKQLIDLYTFIGKMPTLDPAERWTKDANLGLYMTPTQQTNRTKKLPRVITKAAATKEHPAQTEVFAEDVVVGQWDLTKFSGALPEPEQRALLAKVEKLQKAVKFAREEANVIEVDRQRVGDTIFGWLFNEGNATA